MARDVARLRRAEGDDHAGRLDPQAGAAVPQVPAVGVGLGVILDAHRRRRARVARSAGVHDRKPDRLVPEARLVVVVVERDPEIDHPEDDQHEQGQRKRELDQGLSPLGPKAPIDVPHVHRFSPEPSARSSPAWPDRSSGFPSSIVVFDPRYPRWPKWLVTPALWGAAAQPVVPLEVIEFLLSTVLEAACSSCDRPARRGRRKAPAASGRAPVRATPDGRGRRTRNTARGTRRAC